MYFCSLQRRYIYISPEICRKATNRPLYLGAYIRPGCSGHQHFYVFICKSCGSLVVDYPHGYTQGGFLFFECYDCPGAVETSNDRRTILLIKDKKTYEREKTPYPGRGSEVKIDGLTIVASGPGYTILVKNDSPLATKHRKRSPRTFLLIAFAVAAICLIWFYLC